MKNIIKISLVGDIFPSNTSYTKGFGNGSVFLQDHGSLWENNLKNIFVDSDITFGNLEVPLIEDNKKVNESCFAGSVYFAKTLKNMGFSIVSISNNHILEQGSSAFLSTQKALSESGVKYTGVFNDHKSNIVIFEKNGLKFGFAAFNGIKDIPNPNLHADLILENIKITLDEMKSLNIDYRLLSFHWGNEYINIPSYQQIELAHSVIDYGANVIIGHHPHVIQPLERYKNGLIIYSLGNFIFDFLYSKEFRLGMLVDLFIKSDGYIDYKVSEVHLDSKKITLLKPSSSFSTKLNNFETKRYNLFTQSKDDYINYYNSELKKKRSYQRILMKINLLKLFVFSDHRKQLLKNILNRLAEVF